MLIAIILSFLEVKHSKQSTQIAVLMVINKYVLESNGQSMQGSKPLLFSQNGTMGQSSQYID